jgi:hypothetical protein
MVNRDQLIAYLLHQMAEAEREAFSERWFVEPELREELRMAEADLLDAYTRGEVSRERHKQIERYLLASSSQRRKLEFAQALATALPSARPRKIHWVMMGAAAAGLVLVAALSTVIARNRRLENELAHLQSQALSQAQPAPSQGGIYAIFLPAGALRSRAGIRLNLPTGVDVLRLELGLEPGQDREFDSAVVSVSGRIVLRQQPVSLEGAAPVSRASLWIPSKLLAPGNYTIRLESRGTPVAYYSFTVLP